MHSRHMLPWQLPWVPSHLLRCGTGAKFVKSSMRPGVLPSILAALISARSTTRAALKGLDAADVTTRAVLDSRQKALKLVANALYGFTGEHAPILSHHAATWKRLHGSLALHTAMCAYTCANDLACMSK